jgi:leucine dehydrogenase
MGAVLNDSTIPNLKARVVAGAANNQLDETHHGKMLADRGIVYIPDYVANGGGLVSCAAEWYGNEPAIVPQQVRQIYDTSLSILECAREEGIPTAEAADKIARERLAKGNT